MLKKRMMALSDNFNSMLGNLLMGNRSSYSRLDNAEDLPMVAGLEGKVC